MRSRLLLCLLPLLLFGCSTVRVTPERNHAPRAGTPDLMPLVRGDRAATEDFPAADRDGYRPPARLAVLLPMSGPLAPAAAGVRDGLLAAYYAENRQRPTIRFYDSQGTGNGAQAAAAKAMADGAQMIIGPLTREEVNGLATQAHGRIPVITLNRGSQPPASGSASFALLPDDEGVAAANRLADRGVKSVVVFNNHSDPAQRAVTAFTQTLRKRGGVVAAEFPVSTDNTDQSAQLNALPADEAAPQAVFMAVDGGQARAIAAQLKLSRLNALPRIATSQITGGASARSDIELDGIEYPELPWLLGQAGELPDAGVLAKSLSSARGPAQRLFAFGADAWKLAAYYERLYDDPSFTVRGATGLLRIDVSGPVQRTISWAVFSGGRGRPSREELRAPDAVPAR